MTPDELRHVELLQGVGEARLAWIAARGRELRLSLGEPLFAEGDEPKAFYLLLEGRIESYRNVDGNDLPTITHRAGGFIGALPLLGRERYFGSARAAEPTRVLALAPEDFRELLRGEPTVEQRVLGVMMPVARRIEGFTRQREKLAALGGLSAGLAHELNNPAAAARRAAAELREALRALAASPALDPAALGLLSPGPPPADALARADREEELAAVLDRAGVSDAWDRAAPLAEAGVTAEALERVPAGALDAAARWFAASQLLDDVEHAAVRISDLVGSVKEYSYSDQAPQQDVDIHRGLELTLTMLAHKLKHGDVVVERQFAPDLPRVPAYGSELNQVWTNLLDNAIDAVDGHGTIRLRTARAGDRVLVEISDDGPGIPAELRDRIFEPFFTTKDVGAGTGLGLDVSYRVVTQQHKGDLRVLSAPGNTRFQVLLPVFADPRPPS